jgi:PadR family transcriptional regulator PadR
LTFDKKPEYASVVFLQEMLVSEQIDLLQGTLDLLILKTVALEAIHGWGIAQRIQQVSRDVLQVGQGSLYPALHRLERKGLISSDWRSTENNRRAKYYELTRAGRRQLEKELSEWQRLSGAIALVLENA